MKFASVFVRSVAVESGRDTTGGFRTRTFRTTTRHVMTSWLCGLTIIFSGAFTTQAQTVPQVGEPYPDFVLPSIDDQRPIRLSDLRGKKVLLIHFASW